MSTFFGEPMLWRTNLPKQTFGVRKDLRMEILFEGALTLGGELQYWVFAKKVNFW